VLKTPLED